jgi:hypothetical protein
MLNIQKNIEKGTNNFDFLKVYLAPPFPKGTGVAKGG